MKVLQGLWLANKPDVNRRQIATVIALAKKYPDVISAVVVGNEVLLRGDMSVDRPRGHHPRGEGAGIAAGHLCRRLGILAALQRPAERGRLRHHPYPAVLGGFSDAGLACRRPCRRHPQKGRGRHSQQGNRHRRSRLAERGPHARGRAAVAIEPGARHRAKRWRSRSARISASTSSRPSTSRGSASSKARPAVIGAFSTAPRRRRNSVSAAPSPIIRIGFCQAAAGILLAALIFAGALAGRGKAAPPLLWPRIVALAFLPRVLFGWTHRTRPDRQFRRRRLAALARLRGHGRGSADRLRGGLRGGPDAPAFAAVLRRSGRRRARR